MPSTYLAVCAIFRDEARHLAEWLTYYELQGVEHFILYNDQSTDESEEVLRPWRERGMITRYKVTGGTQRQAGAYKHCLETHGAGTRWLGFFDLDEFALAQNGTPLREALAAYESLPGIGLNWALYGSSGYEEQPTSLTMTSYQLRAPIDVRITERALLIPGMPANETASYRRLGAHIKSIVNPAEVTGYVSPHSFAYRNGQYALDMEGNEIRDTPYNAFTKEPLEGPLRINHYWSRSLSEFSAKLARPRADSDTRYPEGMARYKESWMNKTYDPIILPAAKKVADRLGRPYEPGTPEEWIERRHFVEANKRKFP